ncbi:MAG: hypothetical protein M5T61_19260 [Acidimicrobiia bacterium]|nr:hypothetical protein [Acidimicrobiia bacterium]
MAGPLVSGGGVVEAVLEEALDVLSRVDPLGVCLSVDGHREALPAGVGHLADDGFEVGGTVFGLLCSVDGGIEGAAEAVLVVVVRAFQASESGNVGIDGWDCRALR